MSRQEDFSKAGQALAETKRTSVAQAQSRYDFDIAAEYGYQYAVDKYERLIKKLLEQDLGTGYADSFIDDLHKAMEE